MKQIFLKKQINNLSGIIMTAKHTVIESCCMKSDTRICTPAIILLFFFVFH